MKPKRLAPDTPVPANLPDNCVEIIGTRTGGYVCEFRCVICDARWCASLWEGRQTCGAECRREQVRGQMASWKQNPLKHGNPRRRAGEAVRALWAAGHYEGIAPPPRHLVPRPKKLSEAERKERRLSRAVSKAKRVGKLGPRQIHRFRNEIAEALQEQLADAHEVVMGRKEWSPTQARVFSTLLNKVIPDMQANQIPTEEDDRPLNELSR